MARVELEKSSVIDLGDVADTVSTSDFSDYMAADLQMSQKTSNHFAVFWNKEHDVSVGLGPQALLSKSPQSGLMVKDKIKIALQRLKISEAFYILAQFWTPETIEGRHILTSSDQPFGMSHLRNGLCRYRKICASSNYGANGESRGNFLPIGPPSRVFQSELPEYSPNIQFYSTQEYPLRDDADRCKIRHYLALPVFERGSKNCIGVLELVASTQMQVSCNRFMILDIIEQISTELKGAELRTLEKPGQIRTFEIHRGLRQVIRTYHLPFAQAWTHSSDSSSTKEAMFKAVVSSFGVGGITSELKDVCNIFGFMKGKGIVWRAFSSRSSCYCGDITRLRITEYPFAHVAKALGLRSSLAICLQSDRDNYYVLEFFLPPDANEAPRTWLDRLALTMNGYLKSFKFASGQELGKGLKLEVIDSSVDKKVDSFAIQDLQTKEVSVRQEKDGTMLLQNLLDEPLRSEPEASNCRVLQALPESSSKDVTHFSNQLHWWEAFPASPDLSVYSQKDGTNLSNVQSPSQSFQEFDTGGTSNGSNVVEEENVSTPSEHFPDMEELLREDLINCERSFFNLEYFPDIGEILGEDTINFGSSFNWECTSDIQPGEAGTQAESKSKEINRQVLEQHFGMTREDAAQNLGVSTSTLKRRCREHGIMRWPSSKRKQAISSPSHSDNETQTSNYDLEGLEPNLSSGEGATSGVGQTATSTAGRRIISRAQSSQQAARTYNRSAINTGGGAAFNADASLQAATADNRGIMTMKAEYGKKVIKFQVPLSSRMVDLEKEITMRLKLEVGKFDISYLDEDDEWILLTCDADLRIMESMGKTKIRLSITNP